MNMHWVARLVCALLFLLLAVILTTCDVPLGLEDDAEDGETDQPGSGDQDGDESDQPGQVYLADDDDLQLISAGSTSLTIRVDNADHENPDARLTYYLYYSSVYALDTIAAMQAYGTLAASGTDAEIDQGTSPLCFDYTILGLQRDTFYSVNVYVEDQFGNRVAYRPIRPRTGTAILLPGTDHTVAADESTAFVFDLPASAGLFEFELSDPKDVFVAFANGGFLATDEPPLVRVYSRTSSEAVPVALRTPESVQDSNSRLSRVVVRELVADGPLRSEESLSTSENEVVGSVVSFDVQDFTTGSWSVIPATLRDLREYDGVRLKVWVANDSWHEGGSLGNLVTPEMVSALAERVLTAGWGNDVYDYVTNIFGKPWGPHNYAELIPATDTVDILLHDIDADESTTGGTAGYFWAKDSFLRTQGVDPAIDHSNERVMFYVDSVLLAEPEGPSWDQSDFWPQTMVSVMAHELQHMIHFYQRMVLRNLLSEVWYNELLSLATEDAVAGLLEIPGPRGIYTADGSAGSASGITTGRIPFFNAYPEIPAWCWLPDDTDYLIGGVPDVLFSYALHYVVGAHVLRAYGGVETLRKLFLEDHDPDADGISGDYFGLAEALKEPYGYGLGKFTAGLMAATQLSQHTDVPERFRFNKGGWFQDSLDGITYRYGSIDFFTYVNFFGGNGPYVYIPAEFEYVFSSGVPGHSTVTVGYGRHDSGEGAVLLDTYGEILTAASATFVDPD